MSTELAAQWADHFGLALAPLFEARESGDPETHNVLLDGGFGSFAMSVAEDPLWRDPTTAAWAWSSNLPHHVTVSEKIVAVRRWDRPKAEEFSRASVDSQIEPFYAYLTSDRVRSTQRVVDHVLQLFRRMRTLVADARIPDERSVDAFLAFLDTLIQRESGHANLASDVGEGVRLLRTLSAAGLRALTEDVNSSVPFQAFRLFPSLAVRHAGSEIFQEAHFELIRAPGLDLFGYSGPAESRAVTRGGTHFTPAALARSVVEQTLSEVEGLAKRERLTILDLACGSGAFIQEAVRTLRRLNYNGALRLVGRDTSAAAVSMAKFVVGHAVADWEPIGGVQVDIEVADSLETALPRADVVLMNPPFISWAALTPKQRDQMREILGPRLRGRGDMSMAFVTCALDLLTEGGALGVLLPASLLTLRAAEEWRRDLLDRGNLRLLASLGDYGLFAHALVQVAAVVIAKPSQSSVRRAVVRTLVSSNSADATGNALRSLRRTRQGEADSLDGTWRIFEVPTSAIVGQPIWRLSSPKTEAALGRLLEAGAVPIADLFEVRQGVRTGDNKAFLIDQAALSALPKREQRYFRRAVMNESIQDGRILEIYWVFYPYGDATLVIADENSLRDALPVFFKRHLEPRRDSLATRATVERGDNLNWWDLAWSRVSWALDRRPRLVSKYFGGPGGFAPDLRAEFIVVQGFAWLPKWVAEVRDNEDEIEAPSSADLLCAYAAMMNSSQFGRLLERYSPHVAGGQFDLSPRYVDQVPVPNLAELALDKRAGRQITRLAGLGRVPRLADADWRVAADRITADLYGGDFFDQV